MTLDTLIMLAGAFVALLPFLGFPGSWDRVLFFLVGVLVIALGIMVRRRSEGHRAPKEPLTLAEGASQETRLDAEAPPHEGA